MIDKEIFIPVYIGIVVLCCLTVRCLADLYKKTLKKQDVVRKNK